MQKTQMTHEKKEKVVEHINWLADALTAVIGLSFGWFVLGPVFEAWLK